MGMTIGGMGANFGPANVFGGQGGASRAARAVNPEDFIEPGMNITGGWDEHKKIVPVSDDIRDKLVNLVRSHYRNDGGKTDGEERSALIRDYLENVPADDKLSVSWTLSQIYLGEAQRVGDAIKAAVPDWRPGQEVDGGVLDGIFGRGLDVTA